MTTLLGLLLGCAIPVLALAIVRHAAGRDRRIAELEAQVEELRCGDLVAYLDGELSEGRTAAFRDHLARCQACPKDLVLHTQLEARLAELAETRSLR